MSRSLASVTLIVLLTPITVDAGWTVKQITDNDYDDLHP